MNESRRLRRCRIRSNNAVVSVAATCVAWVNTGATERITDDGDTRRGESGSSVAPWPCLEARGALRRYDLLARRRAALARKTLQQLRRCAAPLDIGHVLGGRVREKGKGRHRLAVEGQRHSQRRSIAALRGFEMLLIGLVLKIVNEVVFPIAIGRDRGRHFDNVGKRFGAWSAARIDAGLAAIRQRRGEDEGVVRQHFLRDRGNPLPYLGQLAKPRHRCEHFIKQLQRRGLRAQLLVPRCSSASRSCDSVSAMYAAMRLAINM